VQSGLWPNDTAEPVRRLRTAGLEAFSERGFSGATTRQIASLAGMSPAALYSHYASKADLLFDISHAAHEYALRELQREFAIEGTAVDRVRRLTTTFAQYHASFHTATRIAQYELHSLVPDHYKVIVELRRAMHKIMREAIALGCVDGALAVDDLDSTTTFVLSLGIDVARWYRPGGRLSPEDIGTQCGDLVIRMLRRVRSGA
jgi:AcrR family transcriptional regulator